MSKLTPYPRTFRRVLVRNRLIRSLFIIFALWNLIELHLILRNISEADHDHSYREQPRQKERIYIASVNWNNEPIMRSHWSQALVNLAWKLGPENLYISIYESGSWDNTKGALMELDRELARMQIPRNITLSPVTHQDEIAAPPGDHGWIVTPAGKKELRRIPYLSRIRNLSLEPLQELAAQGITFDKVLFLNDVVFTVRTRISLQLTLSLLLEHCKLTFVQANDVFELLDTNDGNYAAACSLDFSKPPNYYDTFALRDVSGHEAVMSTWPFFQDPVSRYAMKSMSPVPVTSCWNGIGKSIQVKPCLSIHPSHLTRQSRNARRALHRIPATRIPWNRRLPRRIPS